MLKLQPQGSIDFYRSGMPPQLNSSHNDSLMLNKSFLPAYNSRGLSRLKNRDENNLAKGSRNISRELFKGQNNTSYYSKTRMSTQLKSTKTGDSRAALKRLKTPDLCLTNTKDVNESKIASEDSPSHALNVPNHIIYRNFEIGMDDVHTMLAEMIKKCNEVITNTSLFVENGLSTKKIFDD